MSFVIAIVACLGIGLILSLLLMKLLVILYGDNIRRELEDKDVIKIIIGVVTVSWPLSFPIILISSVFFVDFEWKFGTKIMNWVRK